MEASIYNPVTLVSFIQYIVQLSERGTTESSDPPIRIIACCTREVFQAHLLHSILSASDDAGTLAEDADARPTDQAPRPSQDPKASTEDALANDPNLLSATNERRGSRQSPADHPLLQQTLRTLFASAAVGIAFCDSAPVLYAYLTALAISSPDPLAKPESGDTSAATFGRTATETTQDDNKRRLVLLNPVAMHRDSTSYSAQGISRTLAAAFEAAWRLERALIVVETTDTSPLSLQPGLFKEDAEIEQIGRGIDTGADRNDGATQSAQGSGQATGSPRIHERGQPAKLMDPWAAEIPIVNSKTKSFGSAVDRAQMARKTTVRAVAARWFRFQSLP